MSDLIDRQALIEYYCKRDCGMTREECTIGDCHEIGLIEEFPSAEHGTKLTEVGTDCISRQSAIDALENDKAELDRTIKGMSANDAQLDHFVAQHNQVVYDIDAIKHLPPIQTDKDKVSDLLYHIYLIQSPHLDISGVIAKKYYCEELWKELFGKESELPRWMN